MKSYDKQIFINAHLSHIVLMSGIFILYAHLLISTPHAKEKKNEFTKKYNKKNGLIIIERV